MKDRVLYLVAVRYRWYSRHCIDRFVWDKFIWLEYFALWIERRDQFWVVFLSTCERWYLWFG